MASSRHYTALLQLARNHLSSMAICGMVYLRTFTFLLWKAVSPAERQTIASQAFLVKILIPHFSTVRSVVVPVFRWNAPNKYVSPAIDLTFIRHSAPVWVLSVVDLALGTNELSIEQERHTDYPVFDGLKNAHESIPMEKAVEAVDVPAASGTTSTVVRSSA